MADPLVSESTARAAALVGLSVLLFLAGTVTAEFETFPYPQLLERPLTALRAHLVRAGGDNAGQASSGAAGEAGVTAHRPERSHEGWTFYVASGRQEARLVDMEGDSVHRWRLPFREAWPNPPHVDHPIPPDKISWETAYLYRNGDVLVSYSASGATPHGYGLVKIDRDSEPIWRFPERTHHDVEVGPAGEIWVLTHELRDRDEVDVQLAGETPYVIDNDLVRLSPDGEELDRLSLVDLIGDSPMARNLHLWFDGHADWDPIHANDVDVVSGDFAEHHDFAEPGQLVVSMRAVDALAVVDVEDRTLEWMRRGPWSSQHDPELLDDGRMLIFDNHGHPGEGGPSRILEYAPRSRGIPWEYTGDADEPFYTNWAGSHDPLPNGNVLVAESLEGRIFEVTRDREIVWSYRRPGEILRAVERIRPDTLEFTAP